MKKRILGLMLAMYMLAALVPPPASAAALEGSGTATRPYLISNEAQLCMISDFPDAYWRLTNDITLTSEWEPIGKTGDQFSGTLDGNGYKITGFSTNHAVVYGDHALTSFIRENRGTIKNLRLEGTVTTQSIYAGFLAYDNYGTIECCSTAGTITQNNTTHDYCNFAGMVCHNYGTIKNSYTRVKVVKGNWGSGVQRLSSMAGFISYNDETGTVINCYAACEMEWPDVTSSSYLPQGFIGYYNRLGGRSSGTATSCYYDKTLSGCSDSFMASGRTTAAMMIQSGYSGWDFDSVWTMDDTINDGYPYLQVEKSVTRAAQGMRLDRTTVTVYEGGTVQLTPIFTPSNTTNQKVTWSTSDRYTATVDQNGLVTGVSESGNYPATITAVSEDGGFTATCTVNVIASHPVTGISLNRTSVTLTEGDTLTLTPTITPSNADNKNVTWTTSNSGCATVRNGIVTGVSEGTATITATSEDGGYTAYCYVTVNAPYRAVTQIRLSQTTATVGEGGTVILTPTITPSNATNKNVIWVTGDSDIATVNNGVVRGVSDGTTTITAISEDSGVRAYCTVTVYSTTPAYCITSVYAIDYDEYSPIDTIPSNGKFYAVIGHKYLKARNADDYIIAALYDSKGALLSLNYTYTLGYDNLSSGSDETFRLCELSGHPDAAYIKAFIWSSYGSVRSLSNSLQTEVTADNSTGGGDEPETADGYTVTFETDGYVTVNVSETQDFDDPTIVTENARTVYARAGKTGEITKDGSGQVNFQIVLDSGRELNRIVVLSDSEEDDGYSRLMRDPEDTGDTNMYRITRITRNLTVRILTK